MPGRKLSDARKAAARRVAAKPTLLAGGNPQIATAEGDTPVQACIAAMPGWKCDVGRRIDALIVRNVPDVRKAVRWNSPFYGMKGLDIYEHDTLEEKLVASWIRQASELPGRVP
jgi:hypothetical protein